MKKVISFTFALIFAVCVSLAAFADEDASNSHVTSFENIINVYIENQHKTTVTDPTGNVITEEYFSAIMPHYLQHDYGWIEDYTAKTVGELSLMYVQGTSGARGLGITKTTLIISKKPGNTGISRDIRTEFTTDLLLSD